MSDFDLYFKNMEEHAWQLLRNEADKYVYRVDTLDTLGVIGKEGIIAQHEIEEGRKGFFFFVGGKEWAPILARSMMLDPYVLYRIQKKAIDLSSVHWDNVAEEAAAVSFYCLQERVSPKYIKLVNIYGRRPWESDPASSHSQRDQGDDQQGGAESGDGCSKPF